MTTIVICSSPRKENYIHRLLGTINENIKIHFIVSGNDTEYLSQYSKSPNIFITSVSMDSSNSLVRQFINYKHCLSDGYVNGERGIFVIEDDVKFAGGWRARFDTIVSALELKHGDKFVFSVFTSDTMCRNDSLPDCHYLEHKNVRAFHGTQGMYYPNTVRNMIMDYFSTVKESEITNYDVMIARELSKKNIPIYVAIPCLINHIGFKSTWSPINSTPVATIFHPVIA